MLVRDHPENISFLVFDFADWIHIVIYMVILIWVGIYLERLIDSRKYLILVLSGIIVGGIALLLGKTAGFGFGVGAAAILFYYFALPWKKVVITTFYFLIFITI